MRYSLLLIVIVFLSCRKNNNAENFSIYGKWNIVKSYTGLNPSSQFFAKDGSYCEITKDSMHIHTSYGDEGDFSDYTFQIKIVGDKIYTDSEYTGMKYFQIDNYSQNKLIISEFVESADNSNKYDDVVELIR